MFLNKKPGKMDSWTHCLHMIIEQTIELPLTNSSTKWSQERRFVITVFLPLVDHFKLK